MKKRLHLFLALMLAVTMCCQPVYGAKSVKNVSSEEPAQAAEEVSDTAGTETGTEPAEGVSEVQEPTEPAEPATLEPASETQGTQSEEQPEAGASTITVPTETVTVSSDVKIADFYHGQTVTLKGSIDSAVTIKRIEVGIVSDKTANWVTGCKYDNKSMNKTSFQLSAAQSSINFSSLAVGEYHYRIWVHLSNGEITKVVDQPFNVLDKTAQFTFTDVLAPGNYSLGHDFTIGGLITGDLGISRVEIGVVSDKTKDWVSGHKYDNKSVNADTFDVSKAAGSMKFETLAVGKYYYRIWVHSPGGDHQKLIDKAFTVTAATAEFQLEDAKIPEDFYQGKMPEITGQIVCDVKLSRVECGIVDPATKDWVSTCKYDNKTVNAKSLDLAKANEKLKFDELKPGKYIYRIWAHSSNGKVQKLYDEEIVVKEPTVITSYNVPEKMYDGKDIDLNGTVSSQHKIKRIEIGVVNDATNNWVEGCKYDSSSVGAKTFDVSKADASIAFDELSVGNYHYRMWVHHENGYIQKVLDEPFTVKSLFTLTNVSSPTRINFGQGFAVKGTITTAYPDILIKRIEVGIVDDDTADWIYDYKYDNTSVNSNTFDLSVADSTVAFSKLDTGSYHYRIWVHTDNGEIRKVKDVSFKVVKANANLQGIDVSYAQGSINWSKVAKDSKVDFAIIRLGYRGRSNGALTLDSWYKTNIKGANNNGIPAGVYFFTQAKTYAEGKAEADFVIDNIQGYKITLPIVIDTEASGASNNSGRADKLTKAQRTQAVKGFCDEIRARGYEPMIYASTSWLNNKLDMSQLSNNKVWVAQYYTTVTYGGSYVCWQYTSSGSVSGISGRVDMNYWYGSSNFR